MLSGIYPAFEETLRMQGVPLPKNEAAHGADQDLAKRKLDCAVLNWAIPMIEKALKIQFQTVRGVFQEGAAIFPGSAILEKSHIQVVVRDGNCILGYFLPET